MDSKRFDLHHHFESAVSLAKILNGLKSSREKAFGNLNLRNGSNSEEKRNGQSEISFAVTMLVATETLLIGKFSLH